MASPHHPLRDTPRWRKAALQQGPPDEYDVRRFLLLATAFVGSVFFVAGLLLYCA